MAFLKIIQSQLNFVSECSKTRKLLQNLNRMMKTSNEIIEYLDHVQAALAADYEQVYNSTRALIDDPALTPQQKVDLQWGLVHLHTQFELMELAIKTHQKGLQTIE
jgi:5-methylcytosine-specific restriction endonuclease McrBC regulatory subunit McrC